MKLKWEELRDRHGNSTWSAFSPRLNEKNRQAIFSIRALMRNNAVVWLEDSEMDAMLTEDARVWDTIEEAKAALQITNDFFIEELKREEAK